jgi:hypothetical protein
MNSASLYSLAGRYDKPLPTRFLAPMDCLKIPALLDVTILWRYTNKILSMIQMSGKTIMVSLTLSYYEKYVPELGRGLGVVHSEH